jgi:hypothetical protein
MIKYEHVFYDAYGKVVQVDPLTRDEAVLVLNGDAGLLRQYEAQVRDCRLFTLNPSVCLQITREPDPDFTERQEAAHKAVSDAYVAYDAACRALGLASRLHSEAMHLRDLMPGPEADRAVQAFKDLHEIAQDRAKAKWRILNQKVTERDRIQHDYDSDPRN